MSTRLKSLPRLKGLKGDKLTKKLPTPQHITGEQYFLDVEEPHVNEIWIRLGQKPKDYKLAKRVAKLMEKHPNGTIPELVAMDWLDGERIEYIYLAQIYGGHQRKGGVEVDLLFEYQGVGTAWLVHGEYWHSRPEVSTSDAQDKLRFLGATYHGILIEKVVALWENRIYKNRPQVFELGLIGIEMGM